MPHYTKLAWFSLIACLAMIGMSIYACFLQIWVLAVVFGLAAIIGWADRCVRLPRMMRVEHDRKYGRAPHIVKHEYANGNIQFEVFSLHPSHMDAIDLSRHRWLHSEQEAIDKIRSWQRDKLGAIRTTTTTYSLQPDSSLQQKSVADFGRNYIPEEYTAQPVTDLVDL